MTNANQIIVNLNLFIPRINLLVDLMLIQSKIILNNLLINCEEINQTNLFINKL